MTEKKKLSVAEILAAARKSDSSGDAAEAAPASPPPADSAPAAEKPATPAKPAAAGAGGRPSVADILAAARANKGEAAAAPAAKPAAEKPKPAPKPAEKAKPAAAEAKPAGSGVKDTASILAAARGDKKPGPITKAEAAAMGNPIPAPKDPPGKPKLTVPPAPVKPEYAKRKDPKDTVTERRTFFAMTIGALFGSALAVGMTSLTVTSLAWTLGIARFMFPNILTEPPSTFKVGPPSDFPPGAVSDKFKAQFGVWVVNGEYNGQSQIYALRTVCTHLGCTPNWLEGEQKFKCPCHGSGFYKDGINFEGPAPRPLERFSIRLADDGQLEVSKSKTYQEEMGAWADPACFVPV